jgi:hypothetical protein
VFDVEGTFGAAEAQRIHDAIGKLPPGFEAMVDLRKVTRVEDAGIAVLARASSAPSGHPISVRGLGAHQRRILQYLGVIADAVCGGERDAPEQSGVIRLILATT